MKLRTIWLTPDINFHGTFLGAVWHLWQVAACGIGDCCGDGTFNLTDMTTAVLMSSILCWCENVLELAGMCSVELSLVNFSVLSLERFAFELLFLCILLTPCARLPPLPPKMPTSAKFMIIPRSDPTNSTPKQMPTFAGAYLAHM